MDFKIEQINKKQKFNSKLLNIFIHDTYINIYA